jgi:hypothetical protein
MLMCALHSYGIALAGGIVIADLISDAVHEHSIKKCVMRIINNKKLLVLYTVLLAFAVFLIFDIMPRSDTYASELVENKKHNIVICFLFSYLYLPSETLFTSYSTDIQLMQDELNPLYETLIAGFFSIIIWLCLFMISKKRKLIFEFFIPFFFVSILTSTYAAPHHFGIFLMYLLYVLWIASDIERISINDFSEIIKKANISPKLTKVFLLSTAVFFTVINLYWSGYCYYNDIKKAYFPSKALADWIKSENLINNKVLAEADMSAIGQCIAANPYFDNVFYYSLFDDHSFTTHILPTEKEIADTKEKLKANGNPDFIICITPYYAKSICEENNITGEYTAIAYCKPASRFFKDRFEVNDIYVMCTNETYKELYGKDYKQPTFEKKEG